MAVWYFINLVGVFFNATSAQRGNIGPSILSLISTVEPHLRSPYSIPEPLL